MTRRPLSTRPIDITRREMKRALYQQFPDMKHTFPIYKFRITVGEACGANPPVWIIHWTGGPFVDDVVAILSKFKSADCEPVPLRDGICSKCGCCWPSELEGEDFLCFDCNPDAEEVRS